MDGRAFLVSTEGGDIPFGLPHGFGLFHRDCRFLDGLELTVNGKAPTVLSGRGMRVTETRHYLTNPELPGAGRRRPIARNTIAIHRRRLLRAGVVHERLSIRNCGRDPAWLRVELPLPGAVRRHLRRQGLPVADRRRDTPAGIPEPRRARLRGA
jgi:hypothetical protein